MVLEGKNIVMERGWGGGRQRLEYKREIMEYSMWKKIKQTIHR